jgi:cellulose synthase/poly-beta-1,6-N-acetylglucosamine synthase-like glycosyltransferase
MKWSTLLRQMHRWLSIAFTATVVANFVVRGARPGEPPAWITYAPLLPLSVLLLTGVYLFFLPYSIRWRTGRRSA